MQQNNTQNTSAQAEAEAVTTTAYQIGTLRYTLPRLLLVGFIMLLAKQTLAIVCYNLVPQLKPVMLDKIGATASQIAVIIGTIPSILTAVLCPIISTMSDRTRTRWGRRTPYLFWSAPLLALLLILIGFSGTISSWVVHLFPHSTINFHLWILGFFICLFQIAYLFPGSVVYYLDADVIPKKCFGRYMALSSIASLLVSASFSYFLLNICFEHTRLILTIFAFFYMFVYLLQFLLVKEGEYPPVEEKIAQRGSCIRRTADYFLMFFRQCFSRKIFIFLFLCTGLNAASNICRGMFNVLFATKELGLSFVLIGKIAGIASIISALMVYGLGKLMDKTHPMLIYFIGGLLVMLINVFGFFFVYAKPVTYTGDFTLNLLVWSHTFHYSWTYAQVTYSVISIITTLMYAIQNLANTPLQVSIFPMEKFGQYASANSLFINIILIAASAAGGVMTQKFGYRVMFVWDFVITGLATLALAVVYKEWKKHGGKNYQPPVVK